MTGRYESTDWRPNGHRFLFFHFLFLYGPQYKFLFFPIFYEYVAHNRKEVIEKKELVRARSARPLVKRTKF